MEYSFWGKYVSVILTTSETVKDDCPFNFLAATEDEQPKTETIASVGDSIPLRNSAEIKLYNIEFVSPYITVFGFIL